MDRYKLNTEKRYSFGKSGDDFTFSPSQASSKLMNKINNEDVWKNPIDPKTGSITIGSEFNYNPTLNPDDSKNNNTIPKFRNGRFEDRDILEEIDNYVNYKKENKSFKEYMKQYGINR